MSIALVHLFYQYLMLSCSSNSWNSIMPASPRFVNKIAKSLVPWDQIFSNSLFSPVCLLSQRCKQLEHYVVCYFLRIYGCNSCTGAQD
jgi:hypothetical protein